MEPGGRYTGALVSRRSRLCGALLAVSSWSAVASRLLESLIGHATYAFLFRHTCLASFGAVYGNVRAGEDAGKPLTRRPLSPRCRWELITAAVLLSFARMDMQAPLAEQVLASDASPWVCSVCCATAPLAVVGEALRFVELRGEYVSLDGVPARKPSQANRVTSQRPLAEGWPDVEWRTLFGRQWRAPMVQAVGELHTAELSLKYAARRVDGHGAVQLVLLDARAALGASAKGRSNAWPFLRILRRIAALQIATGIEFCPRWISSEEHTADAASRWFQPALARGARDCGLGKASRACCAGDGPPK